MKKIPTVFVRDPQNMSRVTREVTPGCEWVLSGEGVATRKFDGTCCLLRDGKLFKRYDAKNGKTPPPGFEPAQDPDPITGHWPGWLAVGDGPEDWMHRAAPTAGLEDGTYELCGPKVGKNAEGLTGYALLRHGLFQLYDGARNYEALRELLSGVYAEGIVWHHPDGRMAKVKRSDFGLPWPVK